METPTPQDASPSQQLTRDRWFYVALAAATIGVAWLFWHYLYVLLFACVLVVVTWPLFERILRLCRGRRVLAAMLTTLVIGIALVGPAALVVYLFVTETQQIVQATSAYVQDGSARNAMWELGLAWEARIRAVSPEALEWLRGALAGDGDLVSRTQQGALSFLQQIGTGLPGVLTAVLTISIDTILFVFVAITLFIEGPRVLVALKKLSPVDDRYEDRLFEVFREFANNMVIGSLATAGLQGVIAWFGYWVIGMPSAVFLGVLTAITAFVPVIGTLIVWLPVTVFLFVTRGFGAAAFVALWSLLLVGTIDNVLKPMFMRGQTNIHPLLVFLSVFGGVQWMGLPGALIGPVIVAFFLALFTIYRHDFLGEPVEVVVPKRAFYVRWLTSLRASAKRRREARRAAITPR